MSLHRTSAKQYGGLNLTLLALSALSLLLSTSPLAEAARGHKLSGPYPDEPRPYNPCGYFDSDEYLDAGNAHQPCYDANMEVLYCW